MEADSLVVRRHGPGLRSPDREAAAAVDDPQDTPRSGGVPSGDASPDSDWGRSPSSRVRLGEFLAEWLEASKGRIRPTTWRVYSYCVHQHIVPDLGGIPLLRLTSQAIEGWLSQIQAKQLSAATVHQAFRVLRAALRQAVAWGMVPRSPLSLVRSPRVPTREMQVWDEEQVRLFLAEAKRSSRHYALYLTALLTGMRQGELLGLRWTDVDWTFSRVSVNHTLARLQRQVEFREPKSRRSRRTVSLPRVLIEALKGLQAAQEEHGRQHDSGYEVSTMPEI